MVSRTTYFRTSNLFALLSASVIENARSPISSWQVSDLDFFDMLQAAFANEIRTGGETSGTAFLSTRWLEFID